jgi:hypothetical protein
VAPCTAPLTPSATYMIRGYLIPDSPHFGISDTTTQVKVHTGSSVLAAIGTTGVTLGTLAVVGGGVSLFFGLMQSSTDSHRSTFVNLGWGGLIGGAVLAGVGLALGFASVTHVYDESGARLAKARGPRLTLSGVTF